MLYSRRTRILKLIVHLRTYTVFPWGVLVLVVGISIWFGLVVVNDDCILYAMLKIIYVSYYTDWSWALTSTTTLRFNSIERSIRI